MKNNKVWKKLLSLCLVGLFMLPMATFANTKTSVPTVSSRSVKNRELLLIDYSKMAEKFGISCNDLDKTNRPSGDRMKQCLTIAKDLHANLAAFLKKVRFSCRQNPKSE